jgi:hypothetical protein
MHLGGNLPDSLLNHLRLPSPKEADGEQEEGVLKLGS